MMSGTEFCQLALSLPDTEQRVHFDRIGFACKGKRMFATYLAADETANIFLTPAQQASFCRRNTKHIYPVPNKWGDKGATTFELAGLDESLVMEALTTARSEVLKLKRWG